MESQSKYDMESLRSLMRLNDVDRRIWAEELEEFVPQRIFDVHTHTYRWAFNVDPAKESGPYAEIVQRDFREADYARMNAWDAALLPGRRVHRLSFGFPFWPACDFEASNRFAAEQAGQDPHGGALMLVHPSMSPEYLEENVRRHGFLGLKPYRLYASSGDGDNCRITDFLPERHIEVAHRNGLILMVHLAKRDAIADRENIDDLLRLTSQYGNAKWILAHCGRSYSAWAIESAAARLHGLPNVWYDVSSVCESDAVEALISAVGPKRVMYGSDNLPVGSTRGKHIAFGYAWAFLSERNHTLELTHCDSRMTFVLYEQLRAVRRATMRLRLTDAQVEDIFHNTAFDLVQSTRRHPSAAWRVDGGGRWPAPAVSPTMERQGGQSGCTDAVEPFAPGVGGGES
jgi:predicted TIM-barrel fold metal-dependent hydrolase